MQVQDRTSVSFARWRKNNKNKQSVTSCTCSNWKAISYFFPESSTCPSPTHSYPRTTAWSRRRSWKPRELRGFPSQRAGVHGLVFCAYSEAVVRACVVLDTGNLEERLGAPPVQGSRRGVCYQRLVGGFRCRGRQDFERGGVAGSENSNEVRFGLFTF